MLSNIRKATQVRMPCGLVSSWKVLVGKYKQNIHYLDILLGSNAIYCALCNLIAKKFALSLE